MINVAFSASIAKDEKSGWTCVFWQDSVKALGTGKPVKVLASADGYDFEVTLMPVGGFHMVPLKAEVRKKIGKGEGDTANIVIKDFK